MHTKQISLLVAILWATTQLDGLGSEIEFHKIAKFLRDPSEREAILAPYAKNQFHTITGASGDPIGGARVSGLLLSRPDNVSFRDLTGKTFPLFFFPVPDPKELLQASTLEELLAKFLPEDASEEQMQHLFEANDVVIKKLLINEPSMVYGDHIGAYFVDGNRLVGVKCNITYFGGRQKIAGIYKFNMITLEMWYSADLGFWNYGQLEK